MKSLRSGLKVLRLLAKTEGAAGVTEIARSLGADKASVHRILKALVDEGFAERDTSTRRYMLGLGVVELASDRLRQRTLGLFAAPYLESARDTLNETVALMLPDGQRLVCAAVSESRKTVRVAYYIGEILPVKGTSSGVAWISTYPPSKRAALVASLGMGESKEVVERLKREVDEALGSGYAFASHLRTDAGAVAVALVDGSGRCMAVLSAAAHIASLSPERIKEIASVVKATATQLEGDWLNNRSSPIQRIV